MKRFLVLALVLVAVYPASALAESSLVRFEGGIGVTPLSAGPAPNVVRGVSPGGQPWVIADLSADVKTDGRISVAGRGLLLAGGNNIGLNGGQTVSAVLFCGAFPGSSVHSSNLVPLEANGDFGIEDVLAPAVPATCDSAVLLIVNAGGRWFAAGIPRL